MKAVANLKRALERHRWLAISITIVAGLLIGLGFSLRQSRQPYRDRLVVHLIADLQKKDSPFNLLHGLLWELLPGRVRTMMGGGFAPTSAKEVRLRAAAELCRREPKPTNALSALRLLLSDPDVEMRMMALHTLEAFGTAAHRLAPDVIALVGDQVGSTPDLRIQAISTAAVGPDDSATVVALIAALNERTANFADDTRIGNPPSVEHAAASVLGGLARPGNGVVQALVTALRGNEPSLGAAVLEGLAKAGPDEREVVPAVIAAFEKSRKPPAVLPVPRMFPPPEVEWARFRAEAVAALQKLEWARYRSQAVAALQKLARPDNGAVTVLVAALREADSEFSSEILLALGNIGAMTPGVIPAIIHVIERSSLPAAFEALARIGSPAAPAVPILIDLLQPLLAAHQPLEPFTTSATQDTPAPNLVRANPLPEFASHPDGRAPSRRRAQLGRFSLPLQTIGRIGPAAHEAWPVLTKIAVVQTNLWRYEALMARWQIDHRTESALPGLIAGMADPNRQARLRLVQCFQDMGTDGLDGLFVALGDADYEVRKSAVLALGDLGPAAERSVSRLEPLLKDPQNIVRFVAEYALKQIRTGEATPRKGKLPRPPKSHQLPNKG